jgi:hypothetical protein
MRIPGEMVSIEATSRQRFTVAHNRLVLTELVAA